MNVSKIDFHGEAEAEMLEAAEFYYFQKPGLEQRFLNEIDRCLATIQRNPFAWPVIIGPFRKKLLHRFPFSILYRVEDERIFILAVMHQRRRPGYWKSRLV